MDFFVILISFVRRRVILEFCSVHARMSSIEKCDFRNLFIFLDDENQVRTGKKRMKRKKMI